MKDLMECRVFAANYQSLATSISSHYHLTSSLPNTIEVGMATHSNPRISVDESKLEPISHYGPVTSLKFVGNHVLAGYGPRLKIFQISNTEADFQTKLIADQAVFKRSKIHWIAVSPDGSKAFVAGGRSFRIIDLSFLKTNQSPDSSHFNCEKAINEWMVCGEFLDDSTLLLLTSHNIIYKIDFNDYSLLSKIDCGEKSILYSGSIQIDRVSNKVIVAAGTVMSGVIIWNALTREIIHNLTDHKGSIFGVKIDPSFKYIISCSDDRSIKLFDFASGKVLGLGWGHVSRIWNLQFLSNSDGLKMLSTGEDCTTRIWKYVPDSSELESYEVIDNCHSGKHVWSCDVDPESQLVVTGGNDGAIRLHDMAQVDSSVVRYTLEQVSTSSQITFSPSEVIKHFVELKQLNYLICLTSLGQMFGLDQNTNQWAKINTDSKDIFKGFAIMKNIPGTNYVVVSSINGEVLMIRFSEASLDPVDIKWINLDHLNSNKVINLHIAGDNDIYLLLDSPNPKVPLVVHKLVSSSDGLMELQDLFTLPKPERSTFTTTYMAYDAVNNWLIVGTRFVGIMVYDLGSSKCTHFKKITTGDTITSMSILNSSPDYLQLLVVVRDGVYFFMSITSNEEPAFKFEITHENRMFRGFVEGGFMSGNDLIIYGFRSVYFYVWNETKQLEIMKEACGGSHRAWKLFLNDQEFKFVYTSKADLNVKTVTNRFSQGFGLINSGTHGREIRDLVTSPAINPDNSRYILSASEDTIIRIGKIFANGNVKYYWAMNFHVSGLQKVKFLNKNYIASSAANEEFFVWKLTDNQLVNDDIPLIKLHAVLKADSDFPDLRVMDFESYEVSSQRFLLATVYSDSHIKVWDFNSHTKEFKLLIDDFYTTCCILNSKFLTLQGRLYLFISATDGHISIWDIQDKVMPNISGLDLSGNNSSHTTLELPIIRQQLHQSGIKGLHLHQTSDNCIKILTGGDDNALILSTLEQTADEALKLTVNSFIEDAASSTITSIAGDNDIFKIFVTSVDQVVRMWDYSNDGLSLVSSRYTTVADTGCCDVTHIGESRILIIGGIGLSAWKYNQKQ